MLDTSQLDSRLFLSPQGKQATCAAVGPSAVRLAARNSWPLRVSECDLERTRLGITAGLAARGGVLSAAPATPQEGITQIPQAPLALKSGELFQRLSRLHLHNHLQTEIQVSCNQSFQGSVIECAINP